MFLKFEPWKKMLKEAWKSSGLIVGSSEGNYYISGGWWIVKILKDSMNNKEKAAMIELIGEFPEEETIFNARKGCGNQYEICSLEQLIEIMDRNYSQRYRKTKIIYQMEDKFERVYQEDTSQRCMYMNNIIADLIDVNSIDVMEETPPEGPYGIPKENILFWENNIMKIIAYGVRVGEETEEKNVIELLENVKLPGIEM